MIPSLVFDKSWSRVLLGLAVYISLSPYGRSDLTLLVCLKHDFGPPSISWNLMGSVRILELASGRQDQPYH